MFTDLVLEGGVRWIAVVGAISVPEERDYQFRRVAGTSAGAIVGSLVAAMLKSMTVFYDRMHVTAKNLERGPQVSHIESPPHDGVD